ncbi:MAG: PASTA domain-containing protein [Bacteroidetes bacterium]|nr:PASTA domain-containing protein [Bacteroidota bacterium]
MIRWLFNKPVWLNMLVGVGLAVLLFFFWLSSLNWFTKHGRTAVVPNVVGISYNEAKTLLERKGFEVVIEDSIYSDTIPPLQVLRQMPDSAETVKEGRTVFLTITRLVPPEVLMPSLKGQSYRNAEMILKSMDLRVGDTIYRQDFARNAVLDQLYQGKPVAPGTALKKGTRIDLVLGNGVGNQEMPVPNLLGLRYPDARSVMDQMGLGLGVLMMGPDLTDTLSGFVIRQEPKPQVSESLPNRIRAGQLIDLWLGTTPPIRDTLPTPQQ